MNPLLKDFDYKLLDDPEVKALVKKERIQSKALEKERLNAKKFNTLKKVSPALIGIILGILSSRKKAGRQKQIQADVQQAKETFRYKTFAQVLHDTEVAMAKSR